MTCLFNSNVTVHYTICFKQFAVATLESFILNQLFQVIDTNRDLWIGAHADLAYNTNWNLDLKR